MIVRARAPLRLGFGGGGSDLSPYCDLYGGYVLNATIDRFVYATVEPRADGAVEFIAADMEQRWTGNLAWPLPPSDELQLHRGVYNRIVAEFNGGEPLALTLTTMSDAPPGSGLGSSSTLVVAMVKAFVEHLNLPLGEYDVAHLAFEIERRDVGLTGGRQDQYAATFGGVNFMEFYANDRTVVNPLRIKQWILAELEASLLLCHTGQSRSSAAIIAEQIRNLSSAALPEATEAMHLVKAEALQMKESLLRGDLKRFVEAINTGWESKRRTARDISNSRIDELSALARASGARGVKVSGAGGGGFLMFFVDPSARMAVIRAMDGAGAQTTTCHFTKHGTEAWKIL